MMRNREQIDFKEEDMDYQAYFENTKGFGVLSTAGREGKVDSAVYSRPHIFEDGTFGFIMRDRLTHSYVQENPHAVYLFVEEGSRYQGKRLFLKKVREDTDPELIASLKRRKYKEDDDRKLYLVYFQLEQELPLIGPGE
jgi:hypothetical protein